MRTGVFGGAFNPVHFGHIQLLNSYLNSLSLDRVIAIPTADPPHKSGADLASEEDRMNMLSLAFGDNPKVVLSDIEFKLGGKSYTYNTLKELKKLYPEDSFYLFVGSDQYLSFDTWYKPNEILSMATLCTMARKKSDFEKLFEYKSTHENMQDSIISDFKIIEVSSSEIRKRIKAKDSVSGMLPEAVEKYIKEHRLYV